MPPFLFEKCREPLLAHGLKRKRFKRGEPKEHRASHRSRASQNDPSDDFRAKVVSSLGLNLHFHKVMSRQRFCSEPFPQLRKVTQIALKPAGPTTARPLRLRAKSHARDRASRHHRLPLLRHHRQSRQQGQVPRQSRSRSPRRRRVMRRIFQPARDITGFL